MIRWIFLGVGVLVITAFAISFTANRAPYTRGQIVGLTDRLFEFGAVQFVHGFVDSDPLFACVAQGRVLSASQSVTYRQAYQGALQKRQGLFARLDENLLLEADYCMDKSNNAGGQGIAGLHDQHDLSAQANLRDMAVNLAALETVSAVKRAVLANDILKDLTDLMVHMAPAIHSVGTPQLPDVTGLPNELAHPFVRFHAGAKAAQIAPINSANYWQGVDQMQAAYVDIVQWVDAEVRRHNGPVLHALSGRWLSMQTISPRLSDSSPASVQRAANTAVCVL